MKWPILLSVLWIAPALAGEIIIEQGASAGTDQYGDTPGTGSVAIRTGKAIFAELAGGKWRGEDAKYAAISIGMRTTSTWFFEASAGIASYQDLHERFFDTAHTTYGAAIGYEKDGVSLRLGYRHLGDGATYAHPDGQAISEYDLDTGTHTETPHQYPRNTGEQVYLISVGFTY